MLNEGRITEPRRVNRVIGYRVNPLVANAAAELRTPSGCRPVERHDRFHLADSIEAHESFGDRAVVAIAVSASWSLPRWLADVRDRERVRLRRSWKR